MEKKSYHSGLSLIELMIALVLGLSLSVGIFEIYSSTNHLAKVQQAYAQMQQSGRFAVQLLASQISAVGFRGCATRSTKRVVTSLLKDSDQYLWNFSRVIEGAEANRSGGWQPSINSGVNSAKLSAAIKGNDVLTLRRHFGPTIAVSSHAHSAADLIIKAGSGLRHADILLVGNCQQATIFQLTNGSKNRPTINSVIKHRANVTAIVPGNLTAKLGMKYSDANIIKLQTISYYIRNNTVKVPSLYRKVMAKRVEELVEGVEKMQLLYGVDNNDDATVDDYLRADLVTNWQQVVAVRFSLVLRSIGNNLTVDGKPQQYQFNGETINPPSGDSYLRTVFTRTVTLRNSLP